MYIRTDFWRFTLFTALGLCGNACSGEGASPSWVSACGESKLNSKDARGYDLAKCVGNGLEHRPSNGIECKSELPREGTVAVASQFGTAECTSDADCTEKPHGYCADLGVPPGFPTWACEYGCVTDEDCGDGHMCTCGALVGRCVASDCTQDSDCGDGMLCAQAITNADTCGTSLSYRCQRPDDECAVSNDCPTEERRVCNFDGERRVCAAAGPECGRPFLVEGAARLSPLSSTPFGEPGNRVDAACLDAATRQTLGRYWAEIGLMEHASIAAFARFALQLMHVGAPLSLLEATQRAMFDETAHAKACFGIASELLGRSVGPGKLPLDNALAETSLEDIVRLTVREGCIGETVAAIEAAEARVLTQDPHIRSVLERIQGDELRHAELAWRFVQWALAQDAARPNPTTTRSLRDVVREEVASAIAELESPSDVAVSETNAVGAAYGVLPAATRAAVRRAALEGVVGPCAAGLLRTGEGASGGASVALLNV